MTNLTEIFLEHTYSLSQAKTRLILLKAYLENKFFKPNPNLQADEWIISLGEDFFKQFNKLNAGILLKELEKKVAKIQKLTIFIAFEMPEPDLEKLGVWVRKNLRSDILIEIKIDPTLIAGASLSFKGVYRDYSLKMRIEENRERILGSFKSYLR